jgi:hypothetical protein
LACSVAPSRLLVLPPSGRRARMGGGLVSPTRAAITEVSGCGARREEVGALPVYPQVWVNF